MGIALEILLPRPESCDHALGSTTMTLATRSNARCKDDFPRQSHDGGKNEFARHDKGKGKGHKESKGDGKGKDKNMLKSKFQSRDICYKYIQQ